MKKKLLSIVLLFFLLFSASCQKKQVAQIQVENPINQVQENQIEKSIPPETEPETVEDETRPPQKDIPFSSPDLSLSYKKNFIKNEEEYINGKSNYFFIALQIRNNQFEYCIDQNLVRFNLTTKTEKVYKNFFQGLSITAPLFIPGDWIVVKKNRYYYTENIFDGEMLVKNIVCKDADTLKIIWKTKLFKTGNTCYINNKFMHDDKYLYVGFNENYKAYCIEMATGRLVWTFDPFKVFPMLTHKLNNDCEASRASQNLYVKHIFQGGVVFEIHADVDNTKYSSNIYGESMTKCFVVSKDGKFINELDSKAIIFLDDLYLFENGYKNLLDNKIQWSGPIRFKEDEFMRFHKKNNVTINPYIYTSYKKMFYVQNNEAESDVTVFDNKSGSVFWKKQFLNSMIVATIEQDLKYYIFYKENNNGFLLIHDIKSSKEKTIPITLNKEISDYYMDYSTFKAGNHDHLFFSDSLLSFNEEKGLYQSLFSKKELDDYYMQRDFGDWNEPSYFSNQDFFVIAYNPIEYDRGISKGGAFIVLEKK